MLFLLGNKLGKIYMPNISKRQDFALWLRILKKNTKAMGLSNILAYYRVGSSGSVSGNKMLAAKYQWRTYREIEMLPFFSSLYYFTNYAVNGFIRFNK